MPQVWRELGDWIAGHFCDPEDDEPIEVWAEREVLLSPVTAASGKPDFTSYRHLVPPLRRYQDTTTREINFCAPVRGGKNVVAECMLYFAIRKRPAPWLQVMQTAEMAKDFMLQRVWPALDRMRWFDQWQPDFHVSRPVQKGVFGNGMSWRFSGPAKNQLQSFGAATAVIDEVWRLKPGVIDEVKGRLRDFRKIARDKLICISQAGSAECEDWRTQFNSAPVFEWRAPCNGCGELMPLKWSGIRANRSRWGVTYQNESDAQGVRCVETARRTARFECPHCGHAHRDSERTRRKWISRGEYIHQAEDGVLVRECDFRGPKISLRFPSILTDPLPDLVQEWVEALNDLDLSGSTSKRDAFILKNLAEWEDEITDSSEAIEATEEGADFEDGVPVWKERVAACMTVDCQIDHFWYWVEAVNAKGETMVLARGQAYTWPEIQEIQLRFKVSTRMVGVDVSDNRMKRAREIAPFGRFAGGKFISWFGMSGRPMPRGWPSGKKGSPRVFYNMDRINPAHGMNDKERRKRYAKRGIPIIEFAADQYKDETHARFKSGKMSFHPDVDTAIVGQHFAGEHKVLERGKRVWKQIGKRPNHHFDNANMSTVLLSVAGYATLGDGK